VLRKCWSVRWCADMASARWRIVLDQPSPAARPGRRVRGSCGTRPLRPPASLLHNAALPSVPASRCAKAPLGAGHRFAPCRVKATGVMQSGLRWSRSHSRRRFPVVGTPYAPPSARPCGCRGTVALVRRCALCAWSVACGQSCRVCPRPPLCFAAARHQPCALVCPSAPRGGSLSPRAYWVGFCYRFCSWSRTEYGGYRPKRPVSQRGRWLTLQVQPSIRPLWFC
jgi:hypothetical protein